MSAAYEADEYGPHVETHKPVALKPAGGEADHSGAQYRDRMQMTEITNPLGTQADGPIPLGGPGSGHYGHAGRPGLRGGSLPADVAVSIEKGRTAEKRQAAAKASVHSQELASALKEAEIRLWEYHDRGADDERAYVFTKSGKPVLDMQGEGTEVAFSDDQIAQMKDSIVTHSHPTGWQWPAGHLHAAGNSFSPSDLRFAAKTDVAELRAVSRGYVHRIIRPADGWPEYEVVKEAVRTADTGAYDLARDAVFNGTRDINTADADHYHDAAKLYADVIGAIYKRFSYEDYIAGKAFTEVAIPLGGPGSGHYGHAGRPGLRGGSLPADVAVSIEKGRTAKERQKVAASRYIRDPRLVARMKSTVYSLHEEHDDGVPVEIAVGFDADGDYLLEKYGDEDSVSFDDHELAMLKDGILIHTHPLGWLYTGDDPRADGPSLSEPDIITSAINDLKEIVAVGRKSVFSMVRPANGWPGAIDKTVRLQSNMLYRALGMDINDGFLSEEEASATFHDLLCNIVAPMIGATYKKIPYEEYILDGVPLTEVAIPLGGPGSGHYGHAGRPGKRGGSLPSDVAVSIEKGRTADQRRASARRRGNIFKDDPRHSPALAISLTEAVKFMFDDHEYRGAKNERAVAFNGSGDLQFAIKGRRDQVNISTENAKKLKDATMIHTHPAAWSFDLSDPRSEGNSFSLEDVVTGIKVDLDESIVVTRKWVYVMQRPEDGWPAMADAAPIINSEWEDLYNQYAIQLNDMKIDMITATAKFNDHIWRIVAPLLGATYKRYPVEDYINAAVMFTEVAISLGGAGSGHHGHAGRPGKRGGSLPSGKDAPVAKERTEKSEGFDVSGLSTDPRERAKQIRKAIQAMEPGVMKARVKMQAANDAWTEAVKKSKEIKDRTREIERSKPTPGSEDEHKARVQEGVDAYFTAKDEEKVKREVWNLAKEAFDEAQRKAAEDAHALLVAASPERVSSQPIGVHWVLPGDTQGQKDARANVMTAKGFIDSLFRVGAEGSVPEANIYIDPMVARANVLDTDVTLSQWGENQTQSAIHELGHYLENVYTDFGNAAKEFLSKRTTGEDPVWLGSDAAWSERTKGERRSGFSPWEMARPDNFLNPYMGRVYEGGQTEIVSMGLEYLYVRPAEFASRDPDYFDFILSAIWGDRKGKDLSASRISNRLGTQAYEAIPLGGPGSGHWGHAGRPGARGGSLPSDKAVSIETGKDAKRRQALERFKAGDFDPSGLSHDPKVRAKQVRKALQDLAEAVVKQKKDFLAADDAWVKANGEKIKVRNRLEDLDWTHLTPENRDAIERAIEEAKEELVGLSGAQEAAMQDWHHAGEAYQEIKDTVNSTAHAMLAEAAPVRVTSRPIDVHWDHPDSEYPIAKAEAEKAEAFINTFFRAKFKGDLRLWRPNVQVDPTEGFRAICGHTDISISNLSKAATVVHELGHYLENVHADVKQAMNTFLRSRTGDEDAVWLGSNEAWEGKPRRERRRGFDAWEMAKPDRFMTPYMGKIYEGGATEILSMGLEYLYTKPVEFAHADPEYVDAVLAAIWTDLL